MLLFPARIKKLTAILSKDANDRTEDEIKLLSESDELVKSIELKKERKAKQIERKMEVEDSDEEIRNKSIQLARAIKEARHAIVYTGAGISTAADIPDYRGPNGIWTQSKKSGSIGKWLDTLSRATPTFTHMALLELVQKGLVKHVVSQNCDGLHLRSGLPPKKMSEIHGNMFIEICSACGKLIYRDFDVTERTSFHRHATGRNCPFCRKNGKAPPLNDTIVHFGEKGKLPMPLNWSSAKKHVRNADLIICLGSSLQVLRKYDCLWPKSKKDKCRLIIVNLQATPKDSQATLKIRGKCDQVMKYVMEELALLPVSAYKM